MHSMLHVVNGDATVARLEPLALSGDVLVWRDILVEGPVAPDLEIDALAAWRAPWLAQRLGIDASAYAASARTQADGLRAATRAGEIVLWFEQDLFCVANLSFLAAWVARTRPAAHISLILPEAPLGTSDSVTLAELFARRQPFDRVDVGAAWWRGFCANDPRTFRGLDTALPFFETARGLHLARLPSVSTGLGAVDAALLDVLAATPAPFSDLFRATAQDARMRALGMGDLQVAAHIAALAAEPTPLVTITGERRLAEAVFRGWTIGITEAGHAVRRGELDRFDTQPLDWWIGGVHIEGRHSRWRWDAAAGEVRAR